MFKLMDNKRSHFSVLSEYMCLATKTSYNFESLNDANDFCWENTSRVSTSLDQD